MENVPKIVSDRLRVTGRTDSHPDANVLTAFAENSLGTRERENVTAHLAACGDCREIVFLATPPASEVLEVSPARKSGWLSLPMLKWGTAGALAVIVGAAALLLKPGPQHRSAEAQYVVVAPPSAPLPPASAPPATRQLPEAASPAMQLSKNDLKSAVQASKDGTPAKSMQLHLQPTTPPTEAQAYSLPLKGRNADELRQDQPVPAPLVAGVLNKKASGAAANETVNVNGPNLDAPTATAESKETVQDAETAAFEKAKPAQAKAEAGAAPQPMVSSASAALAVNKTAARANGAFFFDGGKTFWRVPSSGEVQRSMDGGRTWNGVSVAQGTSFHVITAVGPHVWAGGSGGALYHSSDAGTTWSAVTPASGQAKLTGDITAIGFSDPQNGKVTTSSGEIWTTSDAGETWQKQ
jgi:hypothetical protein